MALRDWLAGPVATATAATIATEDPDSISPVARVATVAVAKALNQPETPESRWPEYAAALASGALVACVYCRHYAGPPSGALGTCTAFNVEACPVTPFTCRRFSRRAG